MNMSRPHFAVEVILELVLLRIILGIFALTFFCKF